MKKIQKRALDEIIKKEYKILAEKINKIDIETPKLFIQWGVSKNFLTKIEYMRYKHKITIYPYNFFDFFLVNEITPNIENFKTMLIFILIRDLYEIVLNKYKAIDIPYEGKNLFLDELKIYKLTMKCIQNNFHNKRLLLMGKFNLFLFLYEKSDANDKKREYYKQKYLGFIKRINRLD